MRNRAPIFVNGFQRGGTNILVNLISSHPQVEWITETHMVFYGEESEPKLTRVIDRTLYLPILASARHHIFWINKIDKPRKLPRVLYPYVDYLLYRKRMRSADAKDPAKHNGRPAYPLLKNVNALTLATELFKDMYPDARFVGLVRNGLALCEGFVRRGWTAERFAKMYARVCSQMIEDAGANPDYHIVRFEDLLSEPEKEIRQVYACLGLDWNRSQKYRLQAKKSMDKDGQRRYMFGGEVDREMYWFPLEDLPGQFRTDVNENQIAQLKPDDRKVCMQHIGDVMKYFGYV